MMLISEQYTREQLRDMLGIEDKRGWVKALNQKVREMKQRNELMELRPFSEPHKSRKKVSRFVFLAKQESLL